MYHHFMYKLMVYYKLYCKILLEILGFIEVQKNAQYKIDCTALKEGWLS